MQIPSPGMATGGARRDEWRRYPDVAKSRQAWLFLTFCDNVATPPHDRRLYIESGIEVGPPIEIARCDSLSSRWQALFVLAGRVVSAVDVRSQGDLKIDFETGESLTVYGDQDRQASMPPWWIGDSQLPFGAPTQAT